MTAQKFIKRPDTVEAMQFNRDNATAIVAWATGCDEPWVKGENPFAPCPGWWIRQAIFHGAATIDRTYPDNFEWFLVLPSMFSSAESQREAPQAAVGDWIVKIGKSLTVMKPEAFAKAYAPVEEPPVIREWTEDEIEAFARGGPGQVLIRKATPEDINELKAINTQLAGKSMKERGYTDDQIEALEAMRIVPRTPIPEDSGK